MRNRKYLARYAMIALLVAITYGIQMTSRFGVMLLVGLTFGVTGWVSALVDRRILGTNRRVRY